MGYALTRLLGFGCTGPPGGRHQPGADALFRPVPAPLQGVHSSAWAPGFGGLFRGAAPPPAAVGALHPGSWHQPGADALFRPVPAALRTEKRCSSPSARRAVPTSFRPDGLQQSCQLGVLQSLASGGAALWGALAVGRPPSLHCACAPVGRWGRAPSPPSAPPPPRASCGGTHPARWLGSIGPVRHWTTTL